MSESVDVVLVGCSSSKLATEAPARELYTSALFKAARAYAEAKGGPWAILSAKHGLVLPETYLAPYDYSFKSLRAEAARAPKVARSVKGAVEDWGRTVQRELVRRWPGARFVFLAGADYAACLPTFSGAILDGRPARSAPIDSVEPLQGMGIGERVAWLKRATAEMLAAPQSDTIGVCVECDVELIDGARLCATCKLAEERASRAGELDLVPGACDFCGETLECWTSELGSQRFEGDHTPARICESCATHALRQIAALKAAVPA